VAGSPGRRGGRELEVLRLLAGATNRTEATARARELGLLL
jgi:hypothetical protein